MIIESLRPGPISLHTQTHCSIIPSCRFVSSTSQVVSDGFFPPHVWSIFFDIDSGCRRIRTSPLPAIAERSSDKFQPLLLRFSGSNVNLLCDGEIESSLVSRVETCFSLDLFSWLLQFVFDSSLLTVHQLLLVDDLHKSLDELCLFELKFGRCELNKQEKRWSERNENILSVVYIFSTYLNAFPAGWSISQLCVYIGLERWPNEHVPRLMDSFRPVDLYVYTSFLFKKKKKTRPEKIKKMFFDIYLRLDKLLSWANK